MVIKLRLLKIFGNTAVCTIPLFWGKFFPGEKGRKNRWKKCEKKNDIRPKFYGESDFKVSLGANTVKNAE